MSLAIKLPIYRNFKEGICPIKTIETQAIFRLQIMNLSFLLLHFKIKIVLLYSLVHVVVPTLSLAL